MGGVEVLVNESQRLGKRRDLSGAVSRLRTKWGLFVAEVGREGNGLGGRRLHLLGRG